MHQQKIIHHFCYLPLSIHPRVAVMFTELTASLFFMILLGKDTYAFPGIKSRRFQKRSSSLFVLQSSKSCDDTDNKRPTRTQYTIDHDVCPPTRPHLLQAAVEKACASIDIFLERKPIAKHTQQAFDDLNDLISSTQPPQQPKVFVLDSGCGTGRSTKVLSRLHTDCIVIGTDRSFVRLNKNEATSKGANENIADHQQEDQVEYDESPEQPAPPVNSKRSLCVQLSQNSYLVRAELVDFWRCCQKEGWNIRNHYLLYPNPYPTHTRLTQRWYAHPSFPLLLGLGSSTIVVRSNWLGYLEEFATAVQLAHGYYTRNEDSDLKNIAEQCVSSALKGPAPRTDLTHAWTNFEKKYDDVGETTYELRLHATRSVPND